MYLPKVKLVSSSKNTSRIIGTLHVAIRQAQNLPVTDGKELTDPTVKIYLLPNQSSSGKRKTRVVSHNINPIWNENFTYEDVYMDDLLSERVLEVSVWDYDRRGSNDFIGGVRMGPHPDSVSHKLEDWMDSTGDEVAHWEAMLEQPGEWVEQWHTLRPSMEPASKYSTTLSSVHAVKSNGVNRKSITPEAVKNSFSSTLSTTPLPHNHKLPPHDHDHSPSPLPCDQLSPLPAPSTPFPSEQLNHSSKQVDLAEQPSQLHLEGIDVDVGEVGRDGESNEKTPPQDCEEKPKSVPLDGDQLDSTSTNSLYKKPAYDITGEVLVGVYYKNGQLHIHVERARGLAAADHNGYSNPYIKTYLLPDKAKRSKQKTSVKKKTLDPVYNETLKVSCYIF